ncbi:DUF4249 domain-containing protein [Fibrisoma montanum]|uniref:DUF4249 domain-containing protein n=2 Tax=Fibrisoma montanum TaxID=2305895 RepID=A0A418MIZ3_9BACT|nr:DUF4249 domain-containing protein [Fibrisoma montanum]
MTMKRIAGLLLFAAGVLFLMACDSLRQEINPDRLTTEPQKLVVSCFIAPGDTAVVVRVSRSQSVVGTTTPASSTVANALVTFSDGTQSVTLRVRDSQTYMYGILLSGFSEYWAKTSVMPIRAGQTYRLRVEAPGSPAVEAECTVPGPVALSSFTVDSAVINNFGFTSTEYYVRLRWTDPAGQANFYRVAGSNEYSFTTRYTQPNRPPRDTTIRQIGQISFGNNLTVNDAGRDGQDMISGRGQLVASSSFVTGQRQSVRPAGRVAVYLLNVDENYYRYHDAVERQAGTDGNPFAEPVPIPTNIRGGLGCFGAYNRSSLTMELK